MKTFAFLIFLTLMVTETFFAQTPAIEPGLPPGLTKWRAANYSDVRYKLNLTLERQAPLIKGEIEIRVKLSEEGAKNHLYLDFRTKPFAGDKDKPHANIIGVNDVSDFIAQITDEFLMIPSGYLKKGENVIKIEFASPIKTSGAAVTRFLDKEDGAEYIYSLFSASDASTAFPLFDQPDLKAKFQLNIQFEHWSQNNKAISNSIGRPLRMDPMGVLGYKFEETPSISPSVFAFAVGDFKAFSERKDDQAVDKLLTDFKSKGGNDWFALSKKIREVTGNQIFVRKSQAEKFKLNSAEVFRLSRADNKTTKSDIVLLPEIANARINYEGLIFLPESSVFR
jgi:hypothetical protein